MQFGVKPLQSVLASQVLVELAVSVYPVLQLNEAIDW